MFDAHELVVMTKAEAEAVLDAIADLKTIAPAPGAALSDEVKRAVTVWYDLMKDNGWRWRASHLSAALQREGNPYTDGFPLELAWKIRSYVLEAWDCFDRLGKGTAGGAGDLAPLEEYLTKTQAEIVQTADALVTILNRIIDTSTELTQYFDVKSRLEDRLGPVAVGKAIDFNAVFEPYLPDAKVRDAILVRLANDTQFAGAVDTS